MCAFPFCLTAAIRRRIFVNRSQFQSVIRVSERSAKFQYGSNLVIKNPEVSEFQAADASLNVL